MNIEYPRVLETETGLGDDVPVLVAAPRSGHGWEVAKRIYLALLDRGVRAEMWEDPEGELLRTAEGPVIVVGNLADNCCVKMLYYRFLCATDLWYPGPGGYELRTLCDPFGSGHNVILVGYSDADGAEAACDQFVSRLGDSIPHLKELKITRLPLSDVEAEEYRREPLPDSVWQVANTMLGDNKRVSVLPDGGA